MKKLRLWFSLLTLATYSQYCNSQTPTDADEEDLLRSLLNNQTDIATKVKLNADHVPGMVSVLRESDLQLLGIINVWQALSTIPGMNTFETELGERTVKVRGVGGNVNSGSVKVLLNGINVNANQLAQPVAVMDMPIDLIDRIEVIRGPGSTVHGEYAYAAVINITTKASTRNMSLTLGDNNTQQLALNYAWDWPDSSTKLLVNAVASDSDGAENFVAADTVTTSGSDIGFPQAFSSNAPNNTVEDREYQSLHVRLEHQAHYLSVNRLESDESPLFGLLFSLPDETDTIEDEMTLLEAGTHIDMNDRLNINVRAGYKQFEARNNWTVFPAGFSLWANPLSPLLPDGWLIRTQYEEEKFYFDMDTFYQISPAHMLTIMMGLSDASVTESSLVTNINPNGTRDLVDDTPLPSVQRFSFADGARIFDPDLQRSTRYLGIQDEWTLSEQTRITAGLRYDDYSDSGSNVSVRLAAVYQPDESNIFKLQYADAFRPPTFSELSEAPTLTNQTIETADFSYIRLSSWGKQKLTLYWIETDDIVDFSLTQSNFINRPGDEYYGIEYEIEARVNDVFRLNANASYNDSESDLFQTQVARTTNRLANLQLYYAPNSRWLGTLSAQYVGPRTRQALDTRDDLGSYTLVNLAMTYRPKRLPGLSIRASIDNVFDSDVRHPSPLAIDVLGSLYPSYPDDFPRDWRAWWLKVSVDL